MPDFQLETRNLRCERDHRCLFEDLSFTVEPGQFIQIAGANGTGKTTLLRFLAGISTAYEGEILWCGEDIRQDYRNYCEAFLYLGHSPAVTVALTPLENLAWYFSLNQQVSEGAMLEALGRVGLAGYEDIPCFRLSAGQQRRVALARLILSDQALWILDEPFTAIDLNGVKALEDVLEEHAAAGGSVIVTTHHPLDSARLHQRIELGARS